MVLFERLTFLVKDGLKSTEYALYLYHLVRTIGIEADLHAVQTSFM